jgi:hypothetical protein
MIIFVDDCGICAKHANLIDQLIEELEAEGFKLTRESTFAEFLGIQYNQIDSDHVHLTQKGLIKKILEAMQLESCKPKKIPAAKETLGIDPEGALISESWSYPSIIGMLLYLSTDTRPDIAFAVSQVAHFTHNPKQSHGKLFASCFSSVFLLSGSNMILLGFLHFFKYQNILYKASRCRTLGKHARYRCLYVREYTYQLQIPTS